MVKLRRFIKSIEKYEEMLMYYPELIRENIDKYLVEIDIIIKDLNKYIEKKNKKFVKKNNKNTSFLLDAYTGISDGLFDSIRVYYIEFFVILYCSQLEVANKQKEKAEALQRRFQQIKNFYN